MSCSFTIATLLPGTDRHHAVLPGIPRSLGPGVKPIERSEA